MNTRTQMVLLALIVGLCARLLADEPATNPGLSFISVGSHYFSGEGNWLPFGPQGVYGFDVAVEEDFGRQAWRGNEKSDEDSSLFGTIILANEPAATRK